MNERNMYEKMCSKYVSKLDVLDLLVDYFGEYAHVPMPLEEMLDDINPADVVEVVRCKDCKYNPSNPRSWDDDDIVEHYLWCEFMAIESKYNYCSKGARE